MQVVEVESIYSGPEEYVPPVEPISLQFKTDTIFLRDLIRRAVTRQVESLNQKSRESNIAGPQRLAHLYLSPDDIEEMSARGRIAFEYPAPGGELSVERCVQDALEGFRRNRFFVVINGVRPNSLDDIILLSPNSQAQFVRLMPLVGG